MLESISLTDGATVTGIVGAGAAILKYGGQIVAIFARMEIYHKNTSESLQQMNERLGRVESLLADGITIAPSDFLQLKREKAVVNV